MFDLLDNDYVILKHITNIHYKLKTEHTNLWKIYKNRDWQTLILYRRDLFSTIISYCISVLINKWHDIETLKNKINIDRNFFVKSFTFYIDQYRMLVELKKEFDNCKILSYEDLSNDHNDIKKQTGLFLQSNSNHACTHSKNADNSKMIENYKELKLLFYTDLIYSFNVPGINVTKKCSIHIAK